MAKQENIEKELALYSPEFISNDYKSGRKVLTAIEKELLNCDSFIISVAFINDNGIKPLLPILKSLEEKNISGRIMTTNYLTFSEPKALKKLASFKNIELRMYYVEPNAPGFHPKGYMFKKHLDYSIIIGSSNLTASALTVNKEWNIKLTSGAQVQYTQDILTEFHDLWKHAQPIDEWIDKYAEIYEEQRRIARSQQTPSIQQYKLEPNVMQVTFVNNLESIISSQEKRALLISATGTGKTYASAFALRSFGPKKALFIVHREQIAKQAIKAYKNVFGDTKSFGLMSGSSKEYDADILFSTVQTMVKDETLKRFSPEDFDFIVIDEVHRAGATSYQKIMSYFEPKFWLGMTASPERTDGFDIFNLFDHNVAYEIRLKQALEEDLLCTFHYFGISDIEINGRGLDEKTLSDNFAQLVSDNRVDHIIEQANFYGYSGDRVIGLIFCRNNEEAVELSRKMNIRGFSTLALSGSNLQGEREEAISRLVDGDRDDALDYILTVDIFNEGVDIPEVNQVIMLRPTESPIVFVQQLGRGLRKSEDKEYVVILDFIANYKNNFMIPLALSGDRTYNKDTIRRYVMEGSKVIPGSSTIHFDEISKAQIYESINAMKTNLQLLREKYQDLKYRLGAIPTLVDFYDYGDMDPLLLIDYADTYHNFLNRVEKEYKIELSADEATHLEFLSAFIASGKRPHETIILELLMDKQLISTDMIAEKLSVDYNINNDDTSIASALDLLTCKFINSSSDKRKYKNVELIDLRSEKITISQTFVKMLENNEFKKHVMDVVTLSLKKYANEYYDEAKDRNLVLYKKYSRKDVCRLLNWEKDDSSTMYGYRIKHGTCPLFVTYNKKENISKSTQYKDEFINENAFSWMTRSRIREESVEAQKIINSEKDGLVIYLFVNKSDDEGSEFYYLGKVSPIDWLETTTENDSGDILPIVNFQFELEHTVQEDIYDYLLS